MGHTAESWDEVLKKDDKKDGTSSSKERHERCSGDDERCSWRVQQPPCQKKDMRDAVAMTRGVRGVFSSRRVAVAAQLVTAG